MASASIDVQDLAGVFAVPPLPRRVGPRRTIDFDAAEAVAKHIQDGGITRYLYGGNAFLYHITLDEYETLLGDSVSRAVFRPRDRSGKTCQAVYVPKRDGAALQRPP
jgi:hypothetical protein